MANPFAGNVPLNPQKVNRFANKANINAESFNLTSGQVVTLNFDPYISNKVIQVNTYSGSLVAEISCDGLNFFPGPAISGTGLFVVSTPCKFIQITAGGACSGLAIASLTGGGSNSGGSGAASPTWQAPVANAAALPLVGNVPGDARVTLNNGDIYVWTGSSWVLVASPGGTGNAITALLGDVSATGPGAVSATVNSVGGSSATNIHAAELLANASTNLDTVSTIVRRDSSGNFSAGTISANLIGNVTGNVSGSSGSFTGSLAGDVTGTQSATVVSSVGGVPAANVASGANAANAAVSTNTPSTIVRRDSSGNFSAGTITANLVGNVTGSATSFTGSLAGDVTGTQSSTFISKIQGTTITAVTGSGNIVFSASPTLSGTLSAGSGIFSGTLSASNLSGSNSGDITLGTADGLSLAGQILSLQTASAATTGALLASDWSNFNSKQAAGNYITQLEGDVSATGPGLSSATVNSVGGESASNIASVVDEVQAASSSDISGNTLVIRNGGNFSAGTITAALIGHASLDLALSGGTMSGAIAMGSNKITGLANGSNPNDAVNFSQLSLYVPLTEVGAANGVASLDSSGKLPVAQLPTTVMTYQGVWNASTNTPLLLNGTGVNGDVYRTSVAGSVNFGAGAIYFNVGDLAIYNGTLGLWQNSPAADGVVSVNGMTGVVTVNAISQLTGDVTAGPASGSQSQVATISAGAITPSKLGTITDSITLDQSGPGGTLEVKLGGITSAQVSASAGITYSQLSLTNSIMISDIASSQISSSNVPSTIVERDASGNFSAGTIVANLTGNASGTAGNVTATSNSTLVTLSSLSLPAAQVTGLSSLYLALTGGSLTGALNINVSSVDALTINSTSFIFDSTNNALGIGLQPSTTSTLDTINISGAAKPIQNTSYGAGSSIPFRGRFARGTVGSPSAVQTGDNLSVYSGRGYGASQFAAASTGVINIVAGETFTNTSNMTYLQFEATPTGSVTASEHMRIAATGVTLGPQSSSTDIHAIMGGLVRTTNTVTASTYTMDSVTTDDVVFTDSTSNTIAITSPSHKSGRTFVIQDKTGKAGTNSITFTPVSGTINGLSSLVIASNYGGMTVYDDGTNYTALKLATSGQNVLTSGTTYTTPVNVTPQTRFKFTIIGAGGGGGGINTAADAATGGGGGAAVVLYAQGLSPNTAYSISIGAGGTGGISVTTAATAGGNTSITVDSITYTAGGGGPGASSFTGGGGSGGTATNTFGTGFSTGGLNIPGEQGRYGGATTTAAGDGGSSGLLFGARGAGLEAAGNGNPGTGYGGGGAGGRGAFNSGVSGTGGNGAGGAIVVEWSN